MDWKKNQGSLALHSLLNETIKNATKVRDIGDYLASNKQIKILFDNIDVHHQLCISQENLVIYCIDCRIKLTPQELQILKDFFGFETRVGIDFKSLINLLQNQGSKVFLSNHYSSEGKDIDQVFCEYLFAVIGQKLQSFRLLKSLKISQGELKNYLRSNFYQFSENEGFTAEVLKEFMYDSGLYSRSSFMLIKQELFKNSTNLNLEPEILNEKPIKNEQKPKQGMFYSRNSEFSKRNDSHLIKEPTERQPLATESIKSPETRRQAVVEFKQVQSRELISDDPLSKSSLNKPSSPSNFKQTSLSIPVGNSTMNVNSILDQISNIERVLQEKRNRNQERRGDFGVEEGRRSKIIGHILCKTQTEGFQPNSQNKILTETDRAESKLSLIDSQYSNSASRNNHSRHSTKKKSKFYESQQDEEQKQVEPLRQAYSRRNSQDFYRCSRQQEQFKTKKREELMQRASSEAKMKIQEIEKKALQKVFSRPKIGGISRRNNDLKLLERKMEQTMERYRSKDRLDYRWKKEYSYLRTPQNQNLRLF